MAVELVPGDTAKVVSLGALTITIPDPPEPPAIVFPPPPALPPVAPPPPPVLAVPLFAGGALFLTPAPPCSKQESTGPYLLSKNINFIFFYKK